jgi:hypothetical protein
MKFLHLVPNKGLNGSRHYLGSTKDIASRVQYFIDRGIPFEVVGLNKHAKDSVEALRQIPLREFSHVLIEKNNFWSVLRYLRRNGPHLEIWYRGHNAEIPHRIDHFMSAIPPPRLIKIRSALRNIFLFGAMDVYTAPVVDRVLAICEWEQNHYWNFLSSTSRVHNVPFFLSRDYLSEIPKAPIKQAQCVCVTSTSPGPITHDAVRGFARALQDLGPKGHENWQFAVSGYSEPWMEKLFGETGIPVEWKWGASPYEVMAPARAIAIFSDYGRGFKTKILEALQCRARVLTTPGLFRRLPDALKPFCVEVNLGVTDSFRRALEIAATPFPVGEPNELVQNVAYQSLDRILGLQTQLSGSQSNIELERRYWWSSHEAI